MRRRSVTSVITVGAAAAYLLAVRPWQLRWGATGEERAATLAGDDLIAEPVAVVAFVMSQRMLRGIKDRAERGGRPTT
jgi:hypothetical protein